MMQDKKDWSIFLKFLEPYTRNEFALKKEVIKKERLKNGKILLMLIFVAIIL